MSTGAPDSPAPLAAFEILARAGVPFVVIGGHAVAFHGHVRTTEDADVVFLRSPESEARLLAALQLLGARWIGDEIDPGTGLERQHPVTASYIAANHLMKLCIDGGFLDVFDHVPGFPKLDPNELFNDRVMAGNIPFVSLRWLRRLKEKAGRHQDLADLDHLPPA